ncbi:tRNA wybutosine-synthesizing protein 5-like [Leucoraja erinacea]|uniref:tRNA wybutosine-synthesizing protein 5-like n=1 Tax=Leucoraja erinaceus TaxID=7782 RepID=UPI00245827DD|nr:tRNA wybutosine-synthesizing protein 5-like [Leucoraja erinacea]
MDAAAAVVCSKAAVAVHNHADKDTFLREVYPLRKPAVLKGIYLGACTSKWTVDYLSSAGGSQEVKVHVASVPQMDFINKNFNYRLRYRKTGR